jgi:hypothetical protein
MVSTHLQQASLFTFDSAESARTRLQKLFMPVREWGQIISDEQLTQWESEWKSKRKTELKKIELQGNNAVATASAPSE